MIVAGTGPTFGTLSLSSDNLGSATLTLAGGHIASEASFAIARTVNMDVGGGSFDINNADDVVTINGAIVGANGGLTKNGPGTLILANSANSYGGQTVLSAGALQTLGASAIPSTSALTMVAGTQLQLLGNNQTIGSLSGAGAIDLGAATLTSGGNDATTIFAGSIIGSGGLVKSGNGSLTLSGALSFTGGAVVNSGMLDLYGSGSFAGDVTVNSGATVSILTGSGLGASTNTVHLSIGTLQVAAASGTINSPNPVTINTAGAIDVASGMTFIQNGSLTGSGTLSKTNAGTLRFNMPTAFAGSLSIAGGTFSLGNTATASSLTAVSMISGGTLELDNSAAGNTDRIPNAAPVTMAGGNLRMIGAAATSSTESLGAVVAQPRCVEHDTDARLWRSGNPSHLRLPGHTRGRRFAGCDGGESGIGQLPDFYWPNRQHIHGRLGRHQRQLCKIRCHARPRAARCVAIQLVIHRRHEREIVEQRHRIKFREH